jgi:inner membrane protein
MATIFSHPAIPAALALAFGRKIIPRRLLEMGVIASILPDLDVIGFALGIPYESQWGHRGFTHSIAFSLAFAALCA